MVSPNKNHNLSNKTWWMASMDNFKGIRLLDSIKVTFKWWDSQDKIPNRLQTLIIKISIWMAKLLRLWLWCSLNKCICHSISKCRLIKVRYDNQISLIASLRVEVLQRWWGTHLAMRWRRMLNRIIRMMPLASRLMMSITIVIRNTSKDIRNSN